MAAELDLDWTLIYYTFCFVVFLMLSGLIISVRQYMWLTYCGQSFVFLVYFAALDGHISSLLGLAEESAPLVAGIAGAAACTYGFANCGLLLRKEHALSSAKPLLLCLAAVSAIAPLLLIPNLPTSVTTESFHLGLSPLFWLMVAAQVLPPITWFFLPDWTRTTVMPTTVLIVIGIAVFSVLSESGGPLVPLGPSGFRRGMLVWMISSGAIAMLGMTGIIQRARIRSGDRALSAAHGELAAIRAQQNAERDMVRARELANLRGEQLATAAHDIKQPLIALRSSVRLIDDSTGKATSPLMEAIDYVESLAANYINLSSGETDLSESSVEHSETESIDAQLILNSMLAMFAADADNVNIDLRAAASRLILAAPPLVLMRIASNCVSNAIAHSGGTRILVGWRLKGKTAELWVVDDGKGLSETEMAKAFEGGQKGGESTGHGLGLPIVQELAHQHEWNVELNSRRGRGTVLRLCGVKVVRS